MSTPTDGPLDPFGPGAPSFSGPAGAVLEFWLRPVRDVLPTLNATADKPIGQFTVPELMSWALVLGYVFASASLAGAMAGNIVRVAVRGR